MISDDDLRQVYDLYHDLTDTLLQKHNPLAVAEVMMAQALNIYKTVLSPADYERAVGTILEPRDQVKNPTKSVLH